MGPENELLLELLSPASVQSYVDQSPILLIGPSCVGKTTLAMTAATRWLNEGRNRTITMTSGTDFAKSFVRAVKADDMDRFRQLHRNCNCLLVDNVNELSTKPAAQEEFVLTLDQLVQNGSAVICTSTELPTVLPNFRPPLASRLVSGRSLNLVHPNATVRLELIKQLAAHHQFDLSATELQTLAEQVPEETSAIQLNGILLRWWKHDRLTEPRTKTTRRKSIDKIVDAQTARKPSLSTIAKTVAREMNVTLESMQSTVRKSKVVRARGLAMLLMRQLTEESFQNIGVFFGGKDHTTVMHACKKTQSELTQDPVLARSAEQVRQRLRGAS